MNAIDLIDAHMLPFFSTQASTGSQMFISFKKSRCRLKSCSWFFVGSKSWSIVNTDIEWFVDNGQNKKIYLSEVRFHVNGLVEIRSNTASIQNGWPSVTSPGVQPNSPSAVANVQNERVSMQTRFCSF